MIITWLFMEVKNILCSIIRADYVSKKVNTMKFLKETALDQVKRIAEAFLLLPIKETNLSPLFIQHPFFDSPFTCTNGSIVNFMDNEETYKRVLVTYRKKIAGCDSLFDVFVLLRKPYRLAFLKHVCEYMSRKDFSVFLKEIWIESENPNQDPNVPTSMLVRWFRQSDKHYLMSEHEYKLYQELPDYFKVYRGVSPGREHNGLSWTASYEVADWFRKRFETKAKQGYVREGYIHKSDVLAIFEDRNESEVVIDVRKLIEL